MPYSTRSHRRPARALPAAVLAVCMTAVAAAFGVAPVPAPAQELEKHRMILDWFPNADHVPLYVARDGGHFARHGLEIELVPPADPNDPLKLVAAGQAAFGVNYQPNVIIARAEGLPVRSVAVLVEHPLASLAFLKSSGIRTPADLKGRRIGYSVQALELALLRALAERVGLTPDDYETVNVNFNLTSSLLSGQVDAVIGAFWNYEIAELELEGVAGGYFALEDHGIPDYYELIVIANDAFDTAHPETAAKVAAALQEAIDFSRRNPEEALAMYLKANPEVNVELDTRAFRAVIGEFATTQTQSAAKWERWAAFAAEKGLIARPVDAATLFRNP